ncbi:haloalkane dehalogenase [Saccharata proteae CBS 121410]|uniref:Haloalkane dehalogenase n=1 Tax=Saccharata proteae CBS 121410 TaxID=1314787 RepID=A0A6A5YAK7_9PEZI|nr:haloalkane dehalogenase [Saccharata proteae CBS 121410]
MTNTLEKKHATIKGVKMAYHESGSGFPIVFAHGNPTSSHLWRDVLPHLSGLGRLIACDMPGMGDSGPLPGPIGPQSYMYEEMRDYVFALWEHLGVTDNVIFIGHEWGAVLAFDWASQHPEAVKGIAYMEALLRVFTWGHDFPPDYTSVFKAFRSPKGEEIVLERNTFIEILHSVTPGLTEADKELYGRPYLEPGESRRPQLSLCRSIPVTGEGPDSVEKIFARFGAYLEKSQVPKLLIVGDPGELERSREPGLTFARTLPNQLEFGVEGEHFIPEDDPHGVGKAVYDFVRLIQSGTAGV